MKTAIVPHSLPGSIFMQPWWLDIVTDGNWDEIQITSGGELKARWPFYLKKRMGISIIEMPVLTPTLGPWIKQDSPKIERRHSNERNMLENLIELIPPSDKIDIVLDCNISNHLPFKWQGFSQSSKATFEIIQPYTEESQWSELKSNNRNNINQAKRELTIDTTISTAELYSMIFTTYSRQNLKVPYSMNLLNALCNQAIQFGRCDLMGARDNEGILHGAMCLIHDDGRSFYLCGGFNSDSGINGIMNFLIWEAILATLERGNVFDFEGSSVKSIEKFFSSFGARFKPLIQVSYRSKKYLPIQIVRQIVSTLKR